MRAKHRQSVLSAAIAVAAVLTALVLGGWTSLSLDDDPLVRMPGSQRGDVSLGASDNCFNCHDDYNPAVEPGSLWRGNMMAQAARDPFFWATVTVAAQDSIWVLGRPNATDLCIRCHSPTGWLRGNSEPTNGSNLSGSDFDGVACIFCHRTFDPFHEDTFDGSREGDDWLGYWDETDASDTPSSEAALAALVADRPGKLQRKLKGFHRTLDPALDGVARRQAVERTISLDGRKDFRVLLQPVLSTGVTSEKTALPSGTSPNRAPEEVRHIFHGRPI